MRLIIQHEKVEVEIQENFGKKGGKRVAKHEISAPAKKAAKVDNEVELLKWAKTQEPDTEEKVAEIPAATQDNPDDSDSSTS
eukprot:gene15262-22073_t